MTIAETIAALADAFGPKGLWEKIEILVSDRLWLKLADELGMVSRDGQISFSVHSGLDSVGEATIRVYGKTGMVAVFNDSWRGRFRHFRTAIYDAIEAEVAKAAAEHGDHEYSSSYSRIARFLESVENAWRVIREYPEEARTIDALLKVLAMAVTAIEALERERREVENG